MSKNDKSKDNKAIAVLVVDDENKKGDKDKPVPEELSKEDQVLKEGLELAETVTRLREDDTSLHKQARYPLISEFKSSMSSMTSLPKPLNFLRTHYAKLKAVFESWPLMRSMKRLMGNVMSILGMTMAEQGSRECLRFKLLVTQVNISSWGHEYVRALAGEISEEFNQRTLTAPVDDDGDVHDLMVLVDDIVPFQMKHYAEAEAMDLLLEVQQLRKLVETPVVDERNYVRVCLYLLRSAAFIAHPEDLETLYETAYRIYKARKKFADALRVAVKVDRPEYISELFDPAAEASDAERMQMALILGRAHSAFTLDYDADPENTERLNELIGNVNLSERYLEVVRELDLVAPKVPEDIFKIKETAASRALGLLGGAANANALESVASSALPITLGLPNTGVLGFMVNGFFSILRRSPLVWFLILIVFLDTRTVDSAPTLPQSEYLALYDLYNSTNGADWDWADPANPWVFSADAKPCTRHWQGVTCILSNTNPLTFHVVDLVLRGTNLRGPIPNSLGSLTYLSGLTLSDNWLTGSIPSSIGNLTNLQYFDLNFNQLTGSIPSSLGNLTYLLSFDFSDNQLSGSIPSSIGNLSNLYYLDLYVNHLNGSIPSSIGNLTNLQYFYLKFNHLTGSIPSSICKLTLMYDLDLSINKLAGSIPSSIGNLKNLGYLELFSNQLTGSIPSSIGNLTNLPDLYLYNNKLTGSIPSSIGNLKNLGYLGLYNNKLAGSIPSSIGNLKNLGYLELYNNKLSGSIPSSIGNLKNLWYLELYNNQLTGSIPSSIGNLRNLGYLDMNNNKLSGSIPSSIGMLTYLQYLNLNSSKLTGSIPSSIGNLTNLQYLALDRNQLTGSIPNTVGKLRNCLYHLDMNTNHLTSSIPSTIGNLSNLQFLDLSTNQLTGSIPISLKSLTKVVNLNFGVNYLAGAMVDLGNFLVLQGLDLSNNALSGTVPISISNISTLLSLALQKNKLIGPLDGRFTDTLFALLTIQLDDNQFTGELPSALFALPSLRSLSLVGSCLHGTLPGNICNATKLEALILYGLTTGASCRAKGVQSLSQPLTHTQHTFGGAFPSCLLGLPGLTTLLLASNRLTGSIFSSTVVGCNLTELDLSHNDLVGIIPNSLQNHSWSLFDLSHNKFTGVLQSDMFLQGNSSLHLDADANPVISLSSNRLSGSVPSSLRPLQSNLSVLAGNLFECKYDKSNLPQHDSGISNYECASNGFDIAIYVWLGMGAAALAVLLLAYRHLVAQLLTSFIQLPDELSSRLTHLFALLEEFHSLQKAGWLCAAFCMCVLLPYYVTMSHYEGTHTYQYAYVLSAIYTSGVMSFVLDTLLLGLLVVGVYSGGQVFMRGKFVARRLTVYQVTWKRAFVWGAFALVNTTVVLGANVAFVYVVLYQSSQLQTLVQILLSLFKLGWGMVASPLLLRRLKMSFKVMEDANESYFTLQLLVALFNNIAIPCLVVAAIDTNCFSNILLPPNSESVEYSLPVCMSTNATVCNAIVLQPATLQFTPPFTYSYQCSASLITSYAPTFIYMSISTVFLSPLLQHALLILHERLPAGIFTHHMVSKVLPRILKPPKAEESQQVVDSSKAPQHILGSVDTLVALLTQLGILLTFGAIFPPVALTMAVSITAVVVVYRYKVQRFVRTVAEKQLFVYLDVINAECERVGTREQLQVAARIIIFYCCAFYTLFLFDTLGDAVDFEASVWVLIVVPLLPVAVFGGADVHRRYQLHLQRTEELAQGSAKEDVEVEIVGIELSTRAVHGENKEAAGVPGRKGAAEFVWENSDCDEEVWTVNALHSSNV